MQIIKFINKNWELFNDEISKDFIKEIKRNYKDSSFFKDNPCRNKYNKSRIEQSENEIPESGWEDHCRFKLGLEVAEKYSDKIKVIIQQNTIEIQNIRNEKN